MEGIFGKIFSSAGILFSRVVRLHRFHFEFFFEKEHSEPERSVQKFVLSQNGFLDSSKKRFAVERFKSYMEVQRSKVPPNICTVKTSNFVPSSQDASFTTSP